MQELIKNFNIQGVLLFAQVVNFLVIFILLKKFAFKPILKTLEERKETIIQAQKNAEKAAKALEEAESKEREILSTAQKEAKHILENATNQATIMVEKATTKGKQQVEKMLADAKEQMSKDRKETEKELAIQVTKIALDMLKVSLKDLLDEKDAEKIIVKATKAIK